MTRTGVDFNTQKLRCMIVMDDVIGEAFTKPGLTFFRGFVTEERGTGQITARWRFRHSDGSSWTQIGVNSEFEKKSKDEQVVWLVDAMGLSAFAGGTPVPEGAIKAHYPPNPDDAEGTLEWCIANDLMEVTKIEREGRTVPVSQSPDKVM